MAFVDPPTDRPTIIDDGSKCYCLTGVRFEAAVIFLLNKINETSGGTPMTIDEIQQASKCFCLTGVDFERAVIYLLDQILQKVQGN